MYSTSLGKYAVVQEMLQGGPLFLPPPKKQSPRHGGGSSWTLFFSRPFSPMSETLFFGGCSSRLATRPRHVCAADAHTRRPHAVSAVDGQAACAASAVSTTSHLDIAVNGPMLQTKLIDAFPCRDRYHTGDDYTTCAVGYSNYVRMFQITSASWENL